MTIWANVCAFFITFGVTGWLAACELLRKIPGTSYIFVWFVFLLTVLGIAFLCLCKVAERRTDALVERIGQMTITHTEIPHLIKPAYAFINSGYYLLRLYLQGIVRYSHKVEKDAEGEEKVISVLNMDESRLSAIKEQGGRHSTAAINMVRYIRDHAGCSISQVLAQTFTNQVDENEYRVEIAEAQKQSAAVTGLVLAVVLGLAWGLLLAKLRLGIANDKNVGFLVMLLFAGIIAVPLLWTWLMSEIHGDEDARIIAAIGHKHRERPWKISVDLIGKVNDTLPTELERNSILNAYYIDLYQLTKYAEQMSAYTFMYRFVTEYNLVLEACKEAARKAAEAAAASSSSGCSSCGSCSSCGGCGGCGGCGD